MTVRHLVRNGQCGLTMHTGDRPGAHRPVRIAGQQAAATLAIQAAFTRPDPLGFLWLVRLLALRRRQARIVRGFWRLDEPGFEGCNPDRQALNMRPQSPAQGILFGMPQVVEIGKLGHARI
jgi:hypothetical protein